MNTRLSLCVLAFLLTGCQRDDSPVYQGYVEGEYVYLAAPQAGYLKSLDTSRGTQVAEGQAIFVVAADPEMDAPVEAEAQARAEV